MKCPKCTLLISLDDQLLCNQCWLESTGELMSSDITKRLYQIKSSITSSRVKIIKSALQLARWLGVAIIALFLVLFYGSGVGAGGSIIFFLMLYGMILKFPSIWRAIKKAPDSDEISISPSKLKPLLILLVSPVMATWDSIKAIINMFEQKNNIAILNCELECLRRIDE